MKDNPVTQCAGALRQTCYTVVRAVCTGIGRRALSVREIVALTVIRETGGVSLSVLTDHLGGTISGASKLVDGLVGMGYAARAVAADDRRKVILTITEDGNRALGSVEYEEITNLERILSALTPEERAVVDSAAGLLSKAFAQSTADCAESLPQKGE